MNTLPFRVDLESKVAVVTGGSGVLGSAMCRGLAASGAKVAILGRDRGKAEKVAAAIKDAGGVAEGFSCNVLDRAQLETAAASIESTFGPCDILINAAGGNHPKGISGQEYFDPETAGKDPSQTSFFDLDVEGFNFVFALNLLGTLLPSQVFGRQMVGRPGCTIINVSSMTSYRPLTKVVAYSNAKSAVNSFTQWLATHLSRVGIRVNAIAPGFFLGEQNRKLMVQDDGDYTPRAKKIIAQTPMQRLGQPEELVGVLLWLVEPKASGFVTGTIIPIDGGYSAFAGV